MAHENAPAGEWRIGAAILAACGMVSAARGATGRVALDVLAGVILLCCATLTFRSARQEHADAAGFAAVLVAAQQAVWRMTDVLPFAVYQHLRPLQLVAVSRPELLTVLLLQVALVARGVARRRHELGALRDWIVAHRVRAIAAALVIIFALAVPTRDVASFALETVTAGAWTAFAMLNAVLLAVTLPPRVLSRVEAFLSDRLSLPGDAVRPRRWDHRVPIIAAVMGAGGAALIAWLVFERMPHIDDSTSYLFQAKYFSRGRLFLPAPADSAAFHVDEVLITNGRWFGYGFPGWPAVLALGARVGAAWLVNPVLAGASILLVHGLVRRLEDLGTAHLTAMLLAVSPWLLFMSGELLAHPLAAFCSVLALHATARSRERAPAMWGALAGVALGALALVRPLDAVLVAAVVGLWMYASHRGASRLIALGAAVGVSAAIAALLVPYNRLLTGSASYTPQMMWTDRHWGVGSDRYGFGPDVGIRGWPNIDPLPGHGPLDVILNLNKNLFMTQLDLFGWSVGSLVLVIVAAITWQRRSHDALWWGLILLFVAGYSGYWFSGGPDFASRYWYPAIFALAVLSVRGARRLSSAWRAPRSGIASGLAIGVLSASALLSVVPSRAVSKYYRYRGVGGTVRALADSAGMHGALVFVRTPDREFYQSAFNLNAPIPQLGDILFAADAGPESRARVIASVPERPIWIVAPEPGATRRLRVVAGPLPAGRAP